MKRVQLSIQAGAVCMVCVLLLAFAGSGFARSAGQSSSSDSQDRLSTAFTQAATSAVIGIHQSKQNIANVVNKNLPSGYYNPNLAAQAYEQVRQAQIVAKTNGDQQAATLLNSYFTKVKSWAEKYKSDRQSMNATNTMGQDVLGQDPEWQAIESCEKGLNTMLTNRVYSDIASCQ